MKNMYKAGGRGINDARGAVGQIRQRNCFRGLRGRRKGTPRKAMPYLTGAKHACKTLKTTQTGVSKTRLGYIEHTEHKQAATSRENTIGRPACAATSAVDEDGGVDVGMSWCPRPDATNRIPESSIRAPTQAGRLMRGDGGARRVRSRGQISEFAITPTSASTIKCNEQPFELTSHNCVPLR